MHHQVVHCNVQVLICLQFTLLEENQHNICSYQHIPTFELALKKSDAMPTTLNILSSVYCFKDKLPRSHQADFAAGCRATGDTIKKN